MVACALPMVTEHFDHPAVAYAVMLTLADHALQFLPQRSQLRKTQFDLVEPPLSNLIHSFITHVGIVR